MEELTKSQMILLVLMVSFVTSLVTGIVTVSLMEQAPSPITQTINKVVEKMVPIEVEKQSASPTTVIREASQEEKMVKVINKISSAVVSVVATKDIPVIEEYFVNPFENDGFFKQLPENFLPDLKVPQYRQNGTEKKQISSGTGFFISNNGLLLTNKHVVQDLDAEYSLITNDGNKFDAEVLARDPFQDIAILKVIQVEGEEINFNSISLGDSDKLNIGQSVIAIGNALGEFRNTVSVGIISGLNRSVTAYGSSMGAEELQELIQTDAAINPGNSGGPLLDLSGNVIGINTAMSQSAENIGFALPINIAKRDVSDAKEFGEIKYPYLGIRYQSVDDGLLLVKGPNSQPAVDPEGPAGKAEIKEGDIINELGGIKINAQNNLAYLLSKRRVSDVIDLKIFRGKEDSKEEITVSVILGERPAGL